MWNTKRLQGFAARENAPFRRLAHANMCTLLIWKRCHPEFPLIAAAGRDESLDRPSAPPMTLARHPTIVGGKDLTAGGTWLALTEGRFIVAVTNRRDAGAHDDAKRSRGRLVLELARTGSAREAIAAAARIDASAYNPFLLFVADGEEAATVAGGDGGLTVRAIGDGAHALTNWELDAQSPPKAARALVAARTLDLTAADPFALAARCRDALADHGACDPRLALCVHDDGRRWATRSATIVLLGGTPDRSRLFHAEGQPCTAALVEVGLPLRDGTASAASNASD